MGPTPPTLAGTKGGLEPAEAYASYAPDSYMFWAVYELRLTSYGLKTVSNTFSFVRFLAFTQ